MTQLEAKSTVLSVAIGIDNLLNSEIQNCFPYLTDEEGNIVHDKVDTWKALRSETPYESDIDKLKVLQTLRNDFQRWIISYNPITEPIMNAPVPKRGRKAKQ